MAWKIENWSQEIRPTIREYGETYRQLGFRELVIVSCADLDHALAELISKRLRGPVSEIEEFLGADGDGRAPCGSFGSRIQLALLLDIITAQDAELLRRLKAIRNVVAHRVTARYSHREVQGALVKLLRSMVKWIFHRSDSPVVERKDAETHYAKQMRTMKKGKELVLKVVGLFHVRFTCTCENIEPVPVLPEIARVGRRKSTT